MLCSAPSLTQGTWHVWRRWRKAMPALPQTQLPVGVGPRGRTLAPITSSTCGRSLTAGEQNTRMETGKKHDAKYFLLLAFHFVGNCVLASCSHVSDRGFTSAWRARSLARYWRSTWWTWTTRGSCTARAWLPSSVLYLARTAGKGSVTDPRLRYNTHTQCEAVRESAWTRGASEACCCRPDSCYYRSDNNVLSRVIFQIVDNQFILSFTHRLLEVRGATTYFSFCYPFSYSECQEMLQQFDKSHPNAAQLSPSR